MNGIMFKYGGGTMELDRELLPPQYTVLSNDKHAPYSPEEIVLSALQNPIASPPLHQIVNPGERVCIVVSDFTRAYQHPDIFLPHIIEELNRGGVRNEDITLLCAMGSHDPQTQEEKDYILGEKLKNIFTLKEHNCHDERELVYMGTTSRGTEIKVNRAAVECDRLILTGAIIYHDMAGYGGGRKSIIPGIVGYDAVAGNHSLIFDRSENGVLEAACRPGNIEGNPMHLDMLETCEMLKPDFMFNVVLDSETKYYAAVAGDYQKAFLEGILLCDEACVVPIREKGDIVIAGAGGYPKDINLYQVSKTYSQAIEAVKPGGTVIVVAECRENMGNRQSRDIILHYQNNVERRREMRREFCPEAYSGYLMCEYAQSYRLMLVSDYADKDELDICGIELYSSVDDAVRAAAPKEDDLVHIIPVCSSVLPKIKQNAKYTE